ncbi:MAG TPA: hypothetical protein VKG45_13220, partial [Actinomycetes bacterium]|nr:hypothetical protein [Actinomycetes bacterium]
MTARPQRRATISLNLRFPGRTPGTPQGAGPDARPALPPPDRDGAAGGAGAAGRWRRRLLTALELVAVAGVLVLAVLARRPDYLLSHPFWLDESWVVASVRAPLGQLELMTSSTPIGWTLLLRLVPPISSPERYRLLPLAFAVAAVVPAWLLGRRLGGTSWRRHLTGVLVALLVA